MTSKLLDITGNKSRFTVVLKKRFSALKAFRYTHITRKLTEFTAMSAKYGRYFLALVVSLYVHAAQADTTLDPNWYVLTPLLDLRPNFPG